MRPVTLLAAVLLVLTVVPAAHAQEPQKLILDLALEQGMVFVSRLSQPGLPVVAAFHFRYTDRSIERNVAQGSGVVFHKVTWEAAWEDDTAPQGWLINPPGTNTNFITAGNSGTGDFYLVHDAASTQKQVSGLLTVTLSRTNPDESITQTTPFTVVVAPSPGASINLKPLARETFAPDQLVTVNVAIRNLDAYDAPYRVSAVAFDADGIDASQIAFGGTGDYFLEPGEERTVSIVFKAPRQVFWYNSVSMIIQLAVTDSGGGARQTVIVPLTVDGFYVPVNLFALIVGAIAQLLILVLLIVYAHRRYERAFLGRPLPPWTLPAEIAHLERLRREDPRAHYVLRYFLMVEEYRSALLWFHAYKKVSKRQLKAELRAATLQERASTLAAAPLERYERTFERTERRYAHKIERAQVRTQKRLEALQRRLDRSFEKDFEADHEKWEKKVEKLRAKSDRPFLKAKKKWDEETKKALIQWEKPFKKDKEKYERALAKAKAAYAAKVKKADKPTWKEWRLRMEDWDVENKLRAKEGRDPAPEPDLVSAVAGPPELPPAFVPPPRPELPPEPRPTTLIDLPPEPQLATPDLAHSHYSKDARKVEQEGLKRVRELERELAGKLHGMQGALGEGQEKLERKREKILQASKSAQEPSFVDKVLRRTPAESERRHHVAYIKALTKERIKELQEVEETMLERVRIEGERAEAALEAKILAERANLSRAKAGGDVDARASESARIQALTKELGELRIQNAKRLADERRVSKTRLEEATTRLRAEERERLAKETGADAPDAAPARA